MATLGIVADDVTGATTVGALIAREGVEASVYFNHRTLEEDTRGDEEVLITSTDSRPMEPEVAFGRVQRATRSLMRLGARQFSKRIDTTCRGGIGPEVEGMLTALGEDHVAVIVPAMPQSKRIVVGGYSLIDSELLSRTAVAQDVRTPVRQSHLPTLFAEQFSLPLEHIGLSHVLAGHERVAEELARGRAQGRRVFVVDAVTADDVDQIARAVVSLGWRTVCVDPGPFTDRLAVRSGLITPAVVADRGLRSRSLPEDAGTVMVIAGSATTVTHDQVRALRGVEGTRAVGAGVLDLLGPREVFDAECARVVFQVNEILSRGRPRVLVLALETVLTGVRASIEDMERASGQSGQQASTLLTIRFGILARLVADMIGPESCAGFYLTGGDVMINSCLTLGAKGITLVDYVIPQIDQGRISGGPYDGVPIVCKGGLTGSTDTAILSVNRLFDERKISQ